MYRVDDNLCVCSGSMLVAVFVWSLQLHVASCFVVFVVTVLWDRRRCSTTTDPTAETECVPGTGNWNVVDAGCEDADDAGSLIVAICFCGVSS